MDEMSHTMIGSFQTLSLDRVLLTSCPYHYRETSVTDPINRYGPFDLTWEGLKNFSVTDSIARQGPFDNGAPSSTVSLFQILCLHRVLLTVSEQQRVGRLFQTLSIFTQDPLGRKVMLQSKCSVLDLMFTQSPFDQVNKENIFDLLQTLSLIESFRW